MRSNLSAKTPPINPSTTTARYNHNPGTASGAGILLRTAALSINAALAAPAAPARNVPIFRR